MGQLPAPGQLPFSAGARTHQHPGTAAWADGPNLDSPALHSPRAPGRMYFPKDPLLSGRREGCPHSGGAEGHTEKNREPENEVTPVPCAPDLGPETAHSQTACVLAQGQRPALRSEPCGFEAMALDLQTSRPILEVPGAGDATSCQCSLQKVVHPRMQQRGPISRVFDCKSARNVVPLEEGNCCWGGRPGRRRPPRGGACAPWRESAACSSGQPADCAPTS